jgi:hypothetical protein
MTTVRQLQRTIRPALGRRAQLVEPTLGPYTPTLTEFEANLGARRRRVYSGLLRQPRGIQIYPLLEMLPEEGPPPWYPGTLSDWRADVERIALESWVSGCVGRWNWANTLASNSSKDSICRTSGIAWRSRWQLHTSPPSSAADWADRGGIGSGHVLARSQPQGRG